MHAATVRGDDALVPELIALCEELAREAGDVARTRASAGVEVAATKSSDTDVVTAVDREVEQLLRGRLAELRPQDGFLGEEDGHEPGTSGLTWVIDPIDGTVNFLYGIPAWAVSVAVVRGEPDPRTWTALAGCVHAVPTATTWTAGRGHGAWRDGARLRPREDVALGQALVGTGFGYTTRRRTEQAAVVAEVLPQVRDIRRLGSAAIDLCLVADGTLDAYYERGLNPWDMAAGALVVGEAGGAVRGLRGQPASGDMVVAGPAGVVDALTRVLEEAGA